MNNPKITQEALNLAKYIEETWGHIFNIKVEIPIRKILPEPENKGLKHIWRYGSDDIVVSRKKDNKIVSIMEPGGSAHFTDEKQMRNDRRKWKLHQLNGIKCLRIANGVFGQLSKRQKRRLMGKYLFGE